MCKVERWEEKEEAARIADERKKLYAVRKAEAGGLPE
jgi:hypothetical protein